MTRVDRRHHDGDDDDDDASRTPDTVLGSGLTAPPVNVGIRSTPDYANRFTQAAVHELGRGRRVFAGQRADPFHVDTGSIFDLGVLRPFEFAHLIPSAMAMDGVNGLQGFNVHSIAIQVPIRDVSRYGGTPDDPLAPGAVIGVWASASRRKSKVFDARRGKSVSYGPYQQVSRLANPLFNEVIVPMAEKDLWNALEPYQDRRFSKYVLKPELQRLLPVLYPSVFPNLAGYHKPRYDLQAILLTGIPKGIVPGFQNYTGPVLADLVRLNLAVPPSKNPDPIGLIAGDPAGFPTAVGWPTTWSPSSFGRSRAPPFPWWTRLHSRCERGQADGRDDEHQSAVPESVSLPGHSRRGIPDQAGRAGGLISEPRAAG